MNHEQNQSCACDCFIACMDRQSICPPLVILVVQGLQFDTIR